jgi:hypothetical protein
MIASSFTVIDIFKKKEKKHQSDFPNIVVNHKYFLYDYTDMSSEDDNIQSGDIISMLEKIPPKYKLIKDIDYSEKCYIVELISFIIEDEFPKQVAEFKLKFGIV